MSRLQKRAADLERLHVEMLPQPDDFTCGPTCLHAIYSYYGDAISLAEVIATVPKTVSGGTVAVYLANHALRRGYKATLYTYNLRLFDPTWFTKPGVDIADRMRKQCEFKGPKRPQFAQITEGFLDFLALGGDVRFVDPSGELLRRYLRRGVPIVSGLSSTFLYRHPREYGENDDDDDIRGEPQGHFVVLCGYRPRKRSVLVADPFEENPLSPDHHYEVRLERVLCAIMLGVLTHDANLLMIEPSTKGVASTS